ncbi:hypothetical protein CMQ_7356 [Grosmannia clavigera kw1407]|uniref:Uncharacterized protein n=1 Tax=Grosmannia clavigera (strain kw1407 / UAMH 11150) TaxID=655863 RepID=F0XNN3_GROCL|nr:uncharacterized protein CMQ_7356 [Grosmannia clavigera kw1407]EFX00354.1 hypothetical protein CMQ_7356 [Grosmannia clavigera kw1407]
MRFSTTRTLLAALAAAASAPFVQAGPFTITWFSGYSCSGRSLACFGYNSYECCEQPPSPSSFPYARVTSSGPVGIVVFTEVTNTGGCGLCHSTGSINNCYFNSPFETILVASITQCRRSRRRDLDATSLKLPASEAIQEPCNGTVPLTLATVNGHDYDLTGPDRLAIMNDVINMADGDAFAVKWAGAYLGPATDGTPTS